MAPSVQTQSAKPQTRIRRCSFPNLTAGVEKVTSQVKKQDSDTDSLLRRSHTCQQTFPGSISASGSKYGPFRCHTFTLFLMILHLHQSPSLLNWMDWNGTCCQICMRNMPIHSLKTSKASESGLVVYADLARWQIDIAPRSLFILSAPNPIEHGSLIHCCTAWRQIDCEHPDCPSSRGVGGGVWQSSDRRAELILQTCCLFSPASPAPHSLGTCTSIRSERTPPSARQQKNGNNSN